MELDRAALIPVFLSESEDNVAGLEQSILRFETDPKDAEALATVFRCAHTLKGNAEAIGFDAIAVCAHSLEDVLHSVRAGTMAVTADLIATMLQAADALRSMLGDVAASGAVEIADYHAILAALEGAITGGKKRDLRAAPAPGLATQDANGKQTLRVSLETIERMVMLAGELSTSLTRLQVAARKESLRVDTTDRMTESEDLFGQLREEIMRMRLVPMGPMFRSQARSVRDLAQSHDKLARLVVEGDETEVDTALIEGLRDPIIQMIRNAIDHGLETPSERVKRGKDPVGTICLGAEHKKGRVAVWIRDDGAGFNKGRILERARELGMIGSGATPSDDETFALVFAPGFSTKQVVSDLSGRGVGMDIVRRKVTALKGSISVESQEGKGSTIAISVPLTLAIINGFAVESAGQKYVIPADAVSECIEIGPEYTQRPEELGVLNLRGSPLPYLRLHDVFGLPGTRAARESIVVVEHEGGRAGLAVETLHGQSQAVVKPLGKLFERTPMVSGSTILGDGRVALILDVASVVREAELRQKRAPAPRGEG